MLPQLPTPQDFPSFSESRMFDRREAKVRALGLGGEKRERSQEAGTDQKREAVASKINCQILSFLFLWEELQVLLAPGSRCILCAQYQAQDLHG